MGQAMASRWLSHHTDIAMTIIKPSPPDKSIASHKAVQYYASAQEANSNEADIVMLAVKPQMMAAVLPEIIAHYGTSPLYVTIAAGLTLDFYQTCLGNQTRLIRAMPNTPVALGKGVTSLMAGTAATDDDRTLASHLFTTLGINCWLQEESQFDAATAIAGSGPAYAYLFIDVLTQAGIQHGLSDKNARMLATHMLAGAAAMADQSSDSLTSLREQVTSKGGTTEAALSIFMKQDALMHLTGDAIDAAMTRAKALAKSAS